MYIYIYIFMISFTVVLHICICMYWSPAGHRPRLARLRPLRRSHLAEQRLCGFEGWHRVLSCLGWWYPHEAMIISVSLDCNCNVSRSKESIVSMDFFGGPVMGPSFPTIFPHHWSFLWECGNGGPITGGPFCFWFPRRSPSPGVSRFLRLVSGASVYLAGAMKVNSKTKSRYMSLGILESSWSIPKLAMCWLIHENQKMHGMPAFILIFFCPQMDIIVLENNLSFLLLSSHNHLPSVQESEKHLFQRNWLDISMSTC